MAQKHGPCLGTVLGVYVNDSPVHLRSADQVDVVHVFDPQVSEMTVEFSEGQMRMFSSHPLSFRPVFTRVYWLA